MRSLQPSISFYWHFCGESLAADSSSFFLSLSPSKRNDFSKNLPWYSCVKIYLICLVSFLPFSLQRYVGLGSFAKICISCGPAVNHDLKALYFPSSHMWTFLCVSKSPFVYVEFCSFQYVNVSWINECEVFLLSKLPSAVFIDVPLLCVFSKKEISMNFPWFLYILELLCLILFHLDFVKRCWI